MTPPRTESPASAFSAELLAGLVALGVRDVVLAPGSRSQALALVAAELEATGSIRLHVRIDERVAGFLALGLAVESGRPVPVITTSGTAVANLHPAVLEAHHSAVPIVVISADRPEELRGIGSNQTTVQPGIFAGALRAEWDVVAPTGDDAPGRAAELARAIVAAAATGPVHVNLQLREPLSSVLHQRVEPHQRVELVETPVATQEVSTGSTHLIHPGPRTVVIAGHAAGDRAEQLARELDAPLFAEVSSGAHFGPQLVVAWRELLPELGQAIERVIVLGHPTLSREVPLLLQRAGLETIIVTSPGVEAYDPGRAASTITDAVRVEGTASDRSWAGRWVFASRALLDREDAEAVAIAVSDEPGNQAAFGRAVLSTLRAPVDRRDLVEAVWRMTWPHDRLVLGASRLIREADRVVPGKRIRVHANRGLAGIDGTVATGIGIARAAQAGGDERGAVGVTRVLLGDLALLHDAGSLLFGVGETRPRIQVVVGNDNGGTIFDGLEVAAGTPAERFERVMLTPQSIDLAQLAAAYGWEYRRVTTRGELEEALTPSEGSVLVEVVLAR